MPELLTEDIEGVELLRVGGPFRGTGSAPGGDYITLADLHAAAAAHVELRDELHAPMRLMPRGKLGHNDEQDAAREAGFLGGDGAPAVGWMENLRVQGDRLLFDAKKVPKMVAEVIRAGAYRARSAEFWKGYTDQTGKRHPIVVTGYALLGAKLPAVRGLADLVRLYGAEPDAVDFTEYDVAALPEGGPQATRYAVHMLADGSVDPGAATPVDEAARAREAGATDGPTNGTDAGLTPSSAPPADGTQDAARAAVPEPPREGTMPDSIPAELRVALGVNDDAATIEQVTAAAVKLGDDLTADRTKLAAAEAKVADLEKQLATAKSAGDVRFAAVDTEIGTLREKVALGEAASVELAGMKRDTFFAEAVAARKLTPAQVAEWAPKYDESPELVRSLVDGLTPRTDLGETVGDDGKPAPVERKTPSGAPDLADDDELYKRTFGEAPSTTTAGA